MTDISASEQLAQVRTWLQAQIAEYLGRDAHEIDMDSSLAELGLGSVQMLALCGDAEDRFGIVVDPEVVLDFPTPSSLAPEIAALVQSGAHA
ncbi:acyl carrier protein [Pseudoclavibacter sp. AY1F1]|uniref:acyl carrier protein n=1 Tax=Pseudoclavibacter sp. AY1F1 TaxID=2080583 RepID=UPI0015E40E47|nr:acyl carrier protein [Pseudoclavibacter sp. AY1F1]